MPITFSSRICKGPKVHLDSPSIELVATLGKFKDYLYFAHFNLLLIVHWHLYCRAIRRSPENRHNGKSCSECSIFLSIINLAYSMLIQMDCPGVLNWMIGRERGIYRFGNQGKMRRKGGRKRVMLRVREWGGRH